MNRYDMHVHSYYSLCSVMKPEVILKIAKKRGLDGIAVVDHNSMKGSIAVSRLNKDRHFEVIPSMEIRTQFGDVLIYYLQEEVKTTDFFDVVDEAKKQDAIVAIAHPFRLIPHMRFKQDLNNIKDKVDAIESFNGRTFFWENNKADSLTEELNLAKVGGSDAHFVPEIGKGGTMFDDDLRKAIRMRKTRIFGTTIVGPYFALLSFPVRRFRLLKSRHNYKQIL